MLRVLTFVRPQGLTLRRLASRLCLGFAQSLVLVCFCHVGIVAERLGAGSVQTAVALGRLRDCMNGTTRGPEDCPFAIRGRSAWVVLRMISPECARESWRRQRESCRRMSKVDLVPNDASSNYQATLIRS